MVNIKKGLAIILLIIVIILSFNVFAQPPILTQISEQTDLSLTIVYPKEIYYKQNEVGLLHFDVLNHNYTRLDNSTANCSYSIVGFRGEHIAEGDLEYSPTQMHWDLNLTEIETSDIGFYNYYIYCASPGNQNGFISTSYMVTYDGKDQLDDYTSGFSIVVFLLLINMVLFALPFITDLSKNKVTDYILKRLIWCTAFLLLWFNTTIFRTIAVNNGLRIDNLLLPLWWFMTLGTFACIFIIVVVMIIGSLNILKEMQMKKRMGGDEYQK